MQNVTVHEAKTHLSKLIQKVLLGEEVVISKGKQPVVKIVPLEEAAPERKLDGARGVVQFMADDFNEEIDDFEEEPE